MGKECARQAALQHGGYTKEAQTLQRKVMALIRQSKDFLQGFKIA